MVVSNPYGLLKTTVSWHLSPCTLPFSLTSTVTTNQCPGEKQGLCSQITQIQRTWLSPLWTVHDFSEPLFPPCQVIIIVIIIITHIYYCVVKVKWIRVSSPYSQILWIHTTVNQKYWRKITFEICIDFISCHYSLTKTVTNCSSSTWVVLMCLKVFWKLRTGYMQLCSLMEKFWASNVSIKEEFGNQPKVRVKDNSYVENSTGSF